MKKVAFLDRDGVINVDNGYVSRIEDFIFTHGCFEALRQLQRHYDVIIVTNQSGIGRGYYTEAMYFTLTEWYLKTLAEKQIIIQDVFHCPHSPEFGCECRKPKPGLFMQAADKYSIDFQHALMIGDKISDLVAAKAAGVDQLYLINSNDHDGKEIHEYPVYRSLLDVVEHLSLDDVS